jgi:hypothetical protein
VRIEDVRSGRPLPHSSSVVGRVAGSTVHAVDEETVNLVVLGMQQDRSAVSTYIVNGVRAGDARGFSPPHLLLNFYALAT